MFEDILNESWQRELFKFFVAICMFILGFITNGLKDILNKRKDNKALLIYFETRLVKLLTEIESLINPIQEDSSEKTFSFIPKHHTFSMYTIQELAKVNQVKIFTQYFKSVKKCKRKKVTDSFDEVMVMIYRLNKLTSDQEVYYKEYISKLNKDIERWNLAIKDVDNFYIEINRFQPNAEVKNIAFFGKFVKLRNENYLRETEIKDEIQFRMESVNENFIIPLRSLVNDYPDAKYSKEISRIMVSCEEIIRNRQHSMIQLRFNEQIYQNSLKLVQKSIVDFISINSLKNLIKYGYHKNV